MLGRIRSVLAVLEEGSVSRAARRLGVAQPTLSRHIQSLEQEIGAPLFERGSWGMRPTDLGFQLRERMGPVLKHYDVARAEVMAFAQGRHQQVRVGYLGLAAARFLNPALRALKEAHPDVKSVLLDQTPAEQLQALREGTIDVALIGQEGAALAEDFYQRCPVRLPVCVVLPIDHPLCGQEVFSLKKLIGESFVGVSDEAVPGRNRWITDLCVKAGFRPRFIAQTQTVTETFALVAGEGGVALLPDYLEGSAPPGVAFRRLSDRWARWGLFVLRQRGRGSPAARFLVDVLGNQ